jgi:hypothetical protein
MTGSGRAGESFFSNFNRRRRFVLLRQPQSLARDTAFDEKTVMKGPLLALRREMFRPFTWASPHVAAQSARPRWQAVLDQPA